MIVCRDMSEHFLIFTLTSVSQLKVEKNLARITYNYVFLDAGVDITFKCENIFCDWQKFGLKSSNQSGYVSIQIVVVLVADIWSYLPSLKYNRTTWHSGGRWFIWFLKIIHRP